MENSISQQPPKKLKILFWIILGALSVFLAEVVSGADMFPFFHIWGILIVFPLYTLHTLVLASIVFRYGRPNFYTLFIAGTIFGMYEAYITKVLWNPTWGEALIPIGGIAVIELVLLVLFWHSFLSFILPLLLGENMLTNSQETLNGLPSRVKRILSSKTRSCFLFGTLATVFGIIQSTNSPSPIHSLLSGLSTIVVLLLLIFLWRNKTSGRQYEMRALLPNGKEFAVLLILLMVMYLTLGIFIRPEALPGLIPQLVIWLIYAGLFILLGFSLKKSRQAPLTETLNAPLKFSWRLLIVLSILFTFSSTMVNLILGGLGNIIMLMVWLVGSIIGVFTLCLSIKFILQRQEQINTSYSTLKTVGN